MKKYICITITIFLSIIFLIVFGISTYLRSYWDDIYEKARVKDIFRKPIDLSTQGKYIIPFEHIWYREDGYILIIKIKPFFLTKEKIESAFQNIKIYGKLENQEKNMMWEYTFTSKVR